METYEIKYRIGTVVKTLQLSAPDEKEAGKAFSRMNADVSVDDVINVRNVSPGIRVFLLFWFVLTAIFVISGFVLFSKSETTKLWQSVAVGEQMEIAAYVLFSAAICSGAVLLSTFLKHRP